MIPALETFQAGEDREWTQLHADAMGNPKALDGNIV
jgi:hypothetical protein